MVAAAVMACGALGVALLRRPVSDPVPVPAEYAGRVRPAGAKAAEGRVLYEDVCAPCHGLDGRGDGEGAAGLPARPAALAEPGFLAARSDAYLDWRLTRGRTESGMPAFEGALSEAERWAIVAYLREAWDR